MATTTYITSSDLSQPFIDKDTGAPLSGGQIQFWQDANRIVPKPVFEKIDVGVAGNPMYDYVELPNPIILSGTGTIQDANGNNVAAYYYPYDNADALQLYYVAVFNSLGVQQFTREGWPNTYATINPPPPPPGGEAAVVNTVAQVANGFAVQQLVYINAGVYTLAIATTVAAAEVVGIVTTIIDANNFVLTTNGLCTGFAGLVAGTVYWLSDVTPGLMTSVQPVTVGNIQKPVFVAITPTTGYFINYRGKVIPNP